MKSQDITENGYYWYFHDDGKEAVIICFHGGYFMFAGNEMPFQADEVQGEFIGPLRYPPQGTPETRVEYLETVRRGAIHAWEREVGALVSMNRQEACRVGMRAVLAAVYAPPVVSTEMIREAFAHLPVDVHNAPTAIPKWEWFADYLTRALADPDTPCPCCNVTPAGDISPPPDSRG